MKRPYRRHILGWFLFLLMLSSTALAQAPLSIQPRYEEIMRFDPALTISSSGYAQCSSEIRTFDSSYEIDLTMSLQRSSNNGRTWSTVKTWDTTDYGSAALEEGWFVLSGYSYRVKATAEIYDESGDLIEEESVESSVEEY